MQNLFDVIILIWGFQVLFKRVSEANCGKKIYITALPIYLTIVFVW